MTEATGHYGQSDFDPHTPNIARMYDYYLGGKDNFAADREAAEKALSVAPELRAGAAEVRKFLTRAVRYVADRGIRQFLDLGCGLPTQGNVHEIAQSAAPDARVVYVDNDATVISHARALLETNPLTKVVQADLREPEELLSRPAVRELIDFNAPVAVLAVAVLHLIPDDEQVLHIVDVLRAAMAPGSYFVLAHAIGDMRPETTSKLAALYSQSVRMQGPGRPNLRGKAEVARYLEGMELVEPGLVHLSEWRPDPGDEWQGTTPIWAVGGVGRKV
jgi:trans-aconitate methyltransferase